MDGWMDGRKDKWMDGWMDGSKEREISGKSLQKWKTKYFLHKIAAQSRPLTELKGGRLIDSKNSHCELVYR